jgi:hypothetical protein
MTDYTIVLKAADEPLTRVCVIAQCPDVASARALACEKSERRTCREWIVVVAFENALIPIDIDPDYISY